MKYELHKAITTDSGEVVKDFELDFEALSLVDIKNAKKVKAYICDASMGSVDNSTVSPRLDSDLRIGLAWICAVKSNSKLSLIDVLKLSARDALELSEICLSEYLFQ